MRGLSQATSEIRTPQALKGWEGVHYLGDRGDSTKSKEQRNWG
jgi:hypothetical protein